MTATSSASETGFSPKQAALRSAAVIVAISVTGDPMLRGKQVVKVHELARTVVDAGLRVTFDGDRYYLTKPIDPPVLSPESGDNVLSIIGSADRLADLFDLVNQITGCG